MFVPSLFDLAVLRFLRQVGYARKPQIIAWTDSSVGYVNESMARLHRAKLVGHATVPAYLLDKRGRVGRSVTEVWYVTAAGLTHLEPAVVPGTGVEVTVRPLKPSGVLTSHTLAVADVLTALRHWSWECATERVVHAAEQPTKARPNPQQHWIVPSRLALAPGSDPLKVAAFPATRTPDIVAVHPTNGVELAVEVELATTKPRDELARVLASHKSAGRQQAWFVQNGAIVQALIDLAGKRLGITGELKTYGDQEVWWATDMSIALTRYTPGPRIAADADPKSTIPASAPLGIKAERSTVARDEWLVSEGAMDLVGHRTRRQAERAAHAAAEAQLVQRALLEGLAPGRYVIDGVTRIWNGTAWGAPETDAFWDEDAA